MQKSYHVYGIGNALVDMEYPIEDGFLEHNAIAKGHMTLVDETRQAELTMELAGVEPKRGSGGSAANTLIAVSGFGGRAYYSCKVADDEPGRFFVRDLEAAGVATNAQNHHEPGVTGRCLVLITPDAERTMNSFLGISSSLNAHELDEDALLASECLYMEGYLCSSDSARRAVIHARELARAAGVKLFATLSDPSMVEIFRPQLKSMIGEHVDHLFCNEEEALGWTGAADVDAAVEALSKQASSFCITLGARGALVFDGERRIMIPAEKVSAVDTNGAGDIFAGAFIYGLTHGLGYEGAGRLASRAAARLITRFGARLPFEEHRELLT
ncbi:MAG: adenosine kinase [Gammaproteobacteria bacterium]|nr:MAG: adenosine kinase [Gammaproteobacteria bacterium]